MSLFRAFPQYQAQAQNCLRSVYTHSTRLPSVFSGGRAFPCENCVHLLLTYFKETCFVGSCVSDCVSQVDHTILSVNHLP